MRLVDAQVALRALGQPVIRTADAAICLKINRAHASKILERLAKAGLVFSLSRGLWSLSRNLDPLLLPEFLTSPFPSYISLQTALYYHGMISQIPSTIYAVSLARTHSYQTPFGKISIHHLSPDFFFDYDWVKSLNVKIASPEKALLDTLYLTPAKSLLFKTLPELELPEKFDIKKAFRIARKVPAVRRRAMVMGRLEAIMMNPT